MVVILLATAGTGAVLAARTGARQAPFAPHGPVAQVAPTAPVEAVTPIPPIAQYTGEDEARRLRDKLRLAQMSRSLSRCCGTERATLGPLFGKLVIGELGDLMPEVMVHGHPDYLDESNVGLKIDLVPKQGQYAWYLDTAAIAVPDHDLCVELEERLEQMWGPPQRWENPARHQAAQLHWDKPDSDAGTCRLTFYRTATKNAAHCLRDEKPAEFQEIDVKRGCLKRRRSNECMLDRMRFSQWRGSCVVDDKRHAFYSSEGPMFDRFCTEDERKLLRFRDLRDCE
jgi:hypothetical protein